MTDLDLDAIEARANAATEGPWGYPFAGKNRITTPVDIDITEADWGGENLREYVLSCLDDRNAWRAADAEFIAHARTDVPALVAEVRLLREAVRIHAVGASDNAARLAQWEADFPCDAGCLAVNEPQEECSRHGRRPADLWERVEFFARERDDCRRRYEGLRDGVTGLCDDPHAYYSDGRRWVAIHVLRVVVDPQHPGDES